MQHHTYTPAQVDILRQQQPLLNASLIAMAREDPVVFAAIVLADERSGDPIEIQPFQEEWFDLIEQNRQSVLWAPPETGKTQLICVAYILWLLGRDPRKRYAILAATSAQGERTILTIEDHIEHNPVVHEVFPNLRKGPVWSSSQMTVQRPPGIIGPSVQAFGLDQGSIQGRRLDGIFIDDILTDVNTRTAHQRKRVEKYVRSSAFSRLGADGFVVFLANAWHPDDFAHLLERSGWPSGRYPIRDEDGVSIWIEKFPESRLQELEGPVLGPLEFARQMMCRPRDDKTARFKRDWLDRCLARGAGQKLTFGLQFIAPGYGVFTGVDLGIGQDEQHDRTAIFTFLLHPNEDREVLDIQSGQWSGPEIVHRIIQVHRRYQSLVYVENNAAQDYIRQFATAQSAVPVKGLTTTAGRKHNVKFGVESIATEMHNGKWIIPCDENGVPREAEEDVGAWIDEMLYYDPLAHTGDRLMAAWIAREGARIMNTGDVEQGTLDTLRR